MKKILFVLFIGLILLSGCGQQSEEPLCKGIYYEYKTGECCIDKNSNQICDVDEKEETEPVVPISEEKEESEDGGIKPSEQPVQSITVEECSDSSYYHCIWSYITKEEVQFKIKMRQSGVIIVDKIEIPNVPCSKEFGDIFLEKGMKGSEIEQFGNVMKFGEPKQFNVPCDFKKNSVESDLSLYMSFYPREGFLNEDTSDMWMGYIDESKMISKTWISGMVR